MSSINNNGISVCPNGEEMYAIFTTKSSRLKNAKQYQYDYRYTDGELFSTIASTLQECRTQKNNWLITKISPLFEQELIKACIDEHGNIGCYQLYGNVFQRKLGNIASRLSIEHQHIDEIVLALSVNSENLTFGESALENDFISVTLRKGYKIV